MDGIIQNAYQTPDGTVLFSKNDNYQTYYDTNVGKEYHICGGKSRCINNIDNVCTSYILTHGSNIDEIKNKLLWRTTTKNPELCNYVPLCRLDTEHLKAIRRSKGVDHLYQYIIGLILHERKVVERF